MIIFIWKICVAQFDFDIYNIIIVKTHIHRPFHPCHAYLHLRLGLESLNGSEIISKIFKYFLLKISMYHE